MKVYTPYEDEFNIKYHLDRVYLHGKLEDENDHDSFSFEQEHPTENGAHNMIINNQDATLFLWDTPHNVGTRGLLVYRNDTEAMDYAIQLAIKTARSL